MWSENLPIVKSVSPLLKDRVAGAVFDLGVRVKGRGRGRARRRGRVKGRGRVESRGGGG